MTLQVFNRDNTPCSSVYINTVLTRIFKHKNSSKYEQLRVNKARITNQFAD